MGDRAADRPAVAHLRVADVRRRVARPAAQPWASTGSRARSAWRRERADRDPVAVLAHVAQVVEPADVDEQRRPREAQPQQRDQGVPAGEQLRVLARRAARSPRRPSRRARTRRRRGSRAGPRRRLHRLDDVVVARCSGRGCPRARGGSPPPTGSGSPSAARPTPSRSPACRSRTGARGSRGTPAGRDAARRPRRGPRSSSPRRRRPARRAPCTTSPTRRRAAPCTRRRRTCRSRRSSPSGRGRRAGSRRAACAARRPPRARSPLTVIEIFMPSPPGARARRSRRSPACRRASRRSGASASTTALWTAGVEPIVPDSPMPFAPSGFAGVGVSISIVSHDGSSAADGNA